MDIGAPIREIIVEPLENPVPQREPVPAVPMPSPQPEQVPA